MAYNYLIDLYENIKNRLKEAKESLEESRKGQDERETAYQEGRVELLTELESFLESNYNRLLPRKILKVLKEKGPGGIN